MFPFLEMNIVNGYGGKVQLFLCPKRKYGYSL